MNLSQSKKWSGFDYNVNCFPWIVSFGRRASAVVTPILANRAEGKLRSRWKRCWFGFQEESPFQSLMMYKWLASATRRQATHGRQWCSNWHTCNDQIVITEVDHRPHVQIGRYAWSLDKIKGILVPKYKWRQSHGKLELVGSQRARHLSMTLMCLASRKDPFRLWGD